MFVPMPSAATSRTDHELQMLEALVDCAYDLSTVVSGTAEAETDVTRRLQLFEAFQRGFLAVRMGIRLSMMLRAAPKAIARLAVDAAREAPEVERPQTERLLDRAEPDERERERDYEPVSLPKFLSTLGVVASDAARLDGLPAHVRADLLPKLDALLARAKAPGVVAPSTPAAAVAVLTRPKPNPKAALLGATSAICPQPIAFHGQPRPPPYRFG